ncbi:EamA family transporter [Candidatus Woesearchaeota archaeon]|nr:EamA family transporter [Candidatus Woesearchaeota archaeon]
MDTKLWVILLVAFCALLGAIGQLFFKLSSKSLSFNLIVLITNWKLILGLALYAIATILFLIALKHGNLSILYPIIATSYIWVAFLSTIFLKEVFPVYKWLGVLLILGGVIIIVR